jgi:hypothetical protein
MNEPRWREIAREPIPDRTDVLLLAFLDGVPRYGIGGTFKWLHDQIIPYAIDWGWGMPPTHWMPLPSPPLTSAEGD